MAPAAPATSPPTIHPEVPGLAGRLRRWRTAPRWRWAVAAGSALVLAVVVAAVLAGGRSPAGSTAAGDSREVVVTARPLVERLSLVGTMEPGSVVNLVGPFDGAIKEKLVDYGAHVERGQALLVLDTTEIELQMREAEAAALKAERSFGELKAWANTPDVVRARHGVLTAQTSVDEQRRKEKDAKALLSRGIIPRVEYDGIAEQLKAQELQLVAAQQNLDAVLERGGAEPRRLAALELETARKRLGELRRQMDAGLVEAPASGLLLRPVAAPGANGTAPAVVEVGSRVGKGQPLFTIAAAETLNVVARVDEVDVNRISEGQAVEVSGDAFGTMVLAGRVARIAAQAAGGEGASSGRGAAFDVTVAVPALNAEQRRRIRVGMSATIAIVTYSNPAALVVPAEAIRAGAEGHFASVSDASGQAKDVPVIVGRSAEDGVEVLEGLKVGDRLVVSARSGAAGPKAQGLPPALPSLGR